MIQWRGENQQYRRDRTVARAKSLRKEGIESSTQLGGSVLSKSLGNLFIEITREAESIGTDLVGGEWGYPPRVFVFYKWNWKLRVKLGRRYLRYEERKDKKFCIRLILIFFSYFNICEIAVSQMMTCHSLIGRLFSFLLICKIMMYLIISGIWDSNVSYLGMWGSEWIQKMKYYYRAPLRSHLMLTIKISLDASKLLTLLAFSMS